MSAGVGAGRARAATLCYFCNDNASKYSCPRCSELYCSLDCYRSEKHQNCSENFYREWVTETMGGQQAGDDSKSKMIDILTKLRDTSEFDNPEDLMNGCDDENELDSDDDDVVDLQDRIANVNLDDPEAVWNALTEDERNEFEALVSGGDVSKLVPMWEPWWMYSKETKLVEEVKERDIEEEEALNKCPRIKDVAQLTVLSKAAPAECVKFNIMNVLASYAVMMRYFNGEYESWEFISYLLSVCGALPKSSNYSDDETAIGAVAQECINSTLIETDKQSLDVMKQDVQLILKGPSKQNRLHYCNSALSDLHRMCSEVKQRGKNKNGAKQYLAKEFSKKFPAHDDQHFSEIDLSKVKSYVKKLEYYMSYVKSYGLSVVT